MTPETFDKLHDALSLKEDFDGIGHKGNLDSEAWFAFVTELLPRIPDQTLKNCIRSVLRDVPEYDLFREVGEAIGMRFKEAKLGK